MPRVVLTVIAPILVVSAVGYLLARLRLVEDPRPLSRVAMNALLPALAFSALVRSELSGTQMLALGVCAWLVAGFQSILGWLLSRGLAFDSVTTSAFLLSVITMPTAVGAALVAVEFNVRPAFVSGAVLVTTLGSAVTLTILLRFLAG